MTPEEQRRARAYELASNLLVHADRWTDAIVMSVAKDIDKFIRGDADE